MKSEKGRPQATIKYEKPTAVDLGPTAPVVGASCVPGGIILDGACIRTGNGAAGDCEPTGRSAGPILVP
jgi:hypothetical protein